MKIRSLCLLLLLALAAVPAFASPEPAPQVTLADIFSPAPAPAATGALPDIFQEFACVPCSSDAYCQSLCECSIAYCTYRSFCGRKVCDCTVCP